MTILVLATFSVIALAAHNEVADTTKTSGVKISGLTYIAFYYDVSEGSQANNGFDITRLYFTLKKDLSKNIGIRFTTDIGRVSNSQEKGYYRLYLKYGYIELKKPSWKLNLSIGLHDVPLLAWQENIWGYRSISKMLTDLENKQTSSDLGLKLHGQFPKEYGEYAFSFVNGEGYNQPEIGKHKGFYGRMTFRPFPVSIHGLQLTGFASHIQKMESTSTTVYTGFATFQSTTANLGIELSAGNDQIETVKTNFIGTSIYSVFKLSPKWSFIGRIDWFDPDKGRADNSHIREIIGLSYWINKDVELILDYQGVHYQKEVLSMDSNIIYVHLHFVF